MLFEVKCMEKIATAAEAMKIIQQLILILKSVIKERWRVLVM